MKKWFEMSVFLIYDIQIEEFYKYKMYYMYMFFFISRIKIKISCFEEIKIGKRKEN